VGDQPRAGLHSQKLWRTGDKDREARSGVDCKPSLGTASKEQSPSRSTRGWLSFNQPREELVSAMIAPSFRARDPT
jgi:hypothetical protein